ncbi:MAG: 2-phosphosulfolactate phosphatase [Promethearchaeota archaeon]
MSIHVAWGDDISLFPFDDSMICVVIDVLRASSSLATLFSRGVERVHITTSVDDARAFRNSHPRVLICGERNGYPPEGFDYGNSPVKFLNADVRGKTVMLTTSNFTRIANDVIKMGYTEVYSGSLVNASEIVQFLNDRMEKSGKDVILVPAGKKTHAYEDLVGAWFVARHLQATSNGRSVKLFKIPETAFGLLDQADLESQERMFHHIVSRSRHARYLINQGEPFEKDVEFCLKVDAITGSIPSFDVEGNYFLNRTRC